MNVNLIRDDVKISSKPNNATDLTNILVDHVYDVKLSETDEYFRVFISVKYPDKLLALTPLVDQDTDELLGIINIDILVPNIIDIKLVNTKETIEYLKKYFNNTKKLDLSRVLSQFEQ